MIPHYDTKFSQCLNLLKENCVNWLKLHFYCLAFVKRKSGNQIFLVTDYPLGFKVAELKTLISATHSPSRSLS